MGINLVYKEDIIGLIISYLYVGSILLGGGIIKRKRAYPPMLIRKIVHIGIGNWIILAFFLFKNWYFAIIPPLSFIAINYISHKNGLFKSMELGDKLDLSIIYFFFSLVLLIGIFWNLGHAFISVVGIMIMTWGDGFASIIGGRFGRHRLTIFNSQKSLEGALAMFGFAFAATVFTLYVFGDLSLKLVLMDSLIISIFATFLEAISPKGIDNLTVPIFSSSLCYLLVT